MSDAGEAVRRDRVALKLAYDGGDYQGWQLQPSVPTIQGELERAVGRLYGWRERIAVVGAGRTDAGVHALGQIAGFQAPGRRSPETLERGLNSLLPPTIRVLAAAEVPAAFHPCRGALRKTYRYRIVNRQLLLPFERRWAWHLRQELQLGAMMRAAAMLTGRHDFSSFATAGGQSRSSVRTLERLSIARVPGDIVEVEAVGDGFLYRMVRNLVGFLVEVGLGRRAAGEARAVLATRDRSQAGRTAPAAGLCLVGVEYARQVSARLEGRGPAVLESLPRGLPAEGGGETTGSDEQDDG